MAKHIRDENGNIRMKPPTKFARVVHQDDWDAFVTSRVEDSFQVILHTLKLSEVY